MPANPHLAPLFTPIDIGGVACRNRIAMAPMTRSRATGGIVTEEAIGYYRRRAEGGCGLILTEGIAPNRQGAAALDIPELETDDQMAVWRRVVEGVHAAGGCIMAQLWHAGILRGTQGAIDETVPSTGPSGHFPGRHDDRPLATGLSMSGREIERTIADCARFAANARLVGFDGIEIHGAHGYLFDQFFWDRTNLRQDRWNGDIAARSRFTIETIRAMRKATASDFPIGLRFSQWKGVTFYDHKAWTTPAALEAFLGPLVDCGVAFFDCSTRRYWEAEFQGSPLTLAGWTRKLTGVPTMAVGSIGLDGPLRIEAFTTVARPTANLDRLADMIGRGEIDMIAVGRAMLANPDWADRVRTGETDTLRPYNLDALETLQ